MRSDGYRSPRGLVEVAADKGTFEKEERLWMSARFSYRMQAANLLYLSNVRSTTPPQALQCFVRHVTSSGRM